MKHPIADLHCDLLAYLEMDPAREPFDPITRCSYSQLKAGNVHLQTLAIFAHTQKNSTESGWRQAQLFKTLLNRYPSHFKRKKSEGDECVQIIAAIENASGFCEEDEALESGLERLSKIEQEVGQILYIGLTWNEENRFGGGADTKIGLKEDGKTLLQWLNRKKIAIDLSHTSDHLAHDIFNFIDQYSLLIPVIASHSNFRKITDVPRNLPDDLAAEVIRRKGLIGLNFFRLFVGGLNPLDLLHHVEHAFNLNGESALCFGADFFCDNDFPDIAKKYGTTVFYSPEYADASKYPEILQTFHKHLQISEAQLQKIASGNFMNFML